MRQLIMNPSNTAAGSKSGVVGRVSVESIELIATKQSGEQEARLLNEIKQDVSLS